MLLFLNILLRLVFKGKQNIFIYEKKEGLFETQRDIRSHF